MEYEEVDDLKLIKKHYGEKMSHLCRELFPSILECPGLLYHLIESNFNKSRSLYYDIINEHKEYSFKEYIYNLIEEKPKTKKENTHSVKELLDSVGYELYECKDNEDVLSFKKYYREDEVLCTFKDKIRIKNHHIFFLVKKNVEDYNRHDYTHPWREDDYSTSVLCIQFDRGVSQRVSIKSRYNHTVKNPDATYSNNLDLIVPGLTDAFENDYGFNIGNIYKTNFELDHYVRAQDGRLYKYNYEINNVHYCPDNIIIGNGEVIDTYKDKGRYTIFDYFILDEKEKKIFAYTDLIQDSFINEHQDIKDIKITNVGEDREIVLTYKEDKIAIIKIDKNNKIISYKNENIRILGKKFLFYNVSLKEIILPNLFKCDSGFLYKNEYLEEISFPKLESCGDSFIFCNYIISKIDMPKLEKCGDNFLFKNERLKECNLPNLRNCDSYFLSTNCCIESVNFPNLRYVENSFLNNNKSLKELDLPNLRSCWWGFLSSNSSLEKINLPKLESTGPLFLLNSERKFREKYIRR